MNGQGYGDDFTRNAIRKIKAEIEKRVNNGNINGDTELWILLLVSDMHSRVRFIEKNPAMILGKWFRDYPKLAWIVFSITSVISVGGILAIVVTFLNQMGLMIVDCP